LFLLQGKVGSWTELGAQFSLDTRRLEHGYGAWKPEEVIVNVELIGPWAQLWHKDGRCFLIFRTASRSFAVKPFARRRDGY